MNFEYTVKEQSEKQLVGISVQTDMSKGVQDCPALWGRFGSLLAQQTAKGSVFAPGESYGVCIMLDASRFIYWAAFAPQEGVALPEEFEALTLPGGLYVACKAPNLAALGDAYHSLYMTWPQTQSQYELNMQAPCFELYSAGWQLSDPLEIYAPIKQK